MVDSFTDGEGMDSKEGQIVTLKKKHLKKDTLQNRSEP